MLDFDELWWLVRRAEIGLTINWIRTHLEEDPQVGTLLLKVLDQLDPNPSRGGSAGRNCVLIKVLDQFPLFPCVAESSLNESQKKMLEYYMNS